MGTIKFCQGLLPQAAGDSKQKEQKEAPKDFAVGGKTMPAAEVLLSKEARNEEFYFAPTKKGKAGKKKAAGDEKQKPIKHNAETFTLFDKLKLDAPIYTTDVPPLMEKLNAQMEEYQAKVKEWEQNKEDMKKKIMAGEIDLDEDEGDEKEKEAE